MILISCHDHDIKVLEVSLIITKKSKLWRSIIYAIPTIGINWGVWGLVWTGFRWNRKPIQSKFLGLVVGNFFFLNSNWIKPMMNSLDQFDSSISKLFLWQLQIYNNNQVYTIHMGAAITYDSQVSNAEKLQINNSLNNNLITNS